METMRLQKYIALCGVCSRRHAEKLISTGHVCVNDQLVTQMGISVHSGDIVKIDDRVVHLHHKTSTYLFYKPVEVMTTLSDPQGRKTVIDFFKDVDERIYPVGRLDYQTEGLLLMTNDGDLANQIMHPKYLIEKVYFAKVLGSVDDETIKQIRKGVQLDDGKTAPCKVSLLKRDERQSELKIIVHEGRNRIIRRIFEAVGHEVLFLRREAIGQLTLKGLKPGEWRMMTQKELDYLKMQNVFE